MRRFIALVGFVALAVGCETGPDGPGDIQGVVSGPGGDLGAAVFEVVGAGIEGFSGAGGAKVFWARQENPDVYRVVVVGQGDGTLGFNVTVLDRGGRVPRASVISAADLNNDPLLPITKSYQVSFTR